MNLKTNPSKSLKSLFSFILIFFSLQVFAQEGELPEEQVLIQKDRKIVLPELSKPQEKVLNTLKPLPRLAQKYSYREFGLILPLIDPKMQPPAFRPDKESEVKQGYLRLGAGNYGSTALDAWYNSGRSKDFSYGVSLQHLASANGPVENSGFSNNSVGLQAAYFTPSFTLNGNLSYRRDRYNFYGYDQERFKKRTSDTTKQIFNSVWFRMDLISRQKEKENLSWNAGLGLGNISDYFRASESEVLLDFNGRYRLGDSASIRLFSDFSLLKRSDSSSQNRALWRIQPAYHFGFKGFRVDAGLQFSLSSEPVLQKNGIFKESGAFHVHPRLNVELALADEKLLAFAGVAGGMNRRSFRRHAEQNPYLMSNVYLRHENQLLDLFFGLKGQMKGLLQYHSRVSFEKLDQQAFYLNADSVSREKFRIVYDSASTRRFSWETEAVYDPGKGSRAGIRFVYYSYRLGSLKEAWHLPASVFTAFGSLSVSDNLSLSGEFLVLAGLKARNPLNFNTEKLPAMADLNLKGEYHFKNRYSAFMSVNNLLNNKNPRYLYYPSQGLRIMLGGSVIF